MCSRDGYIWKAWLGGQTHLKPPKFGENLRALSEAIGNPAYTMITVPHSLHTMVYTEIKVYVN